MSSGIYEIVNTLNGHRYIGSAVNIGKRWSQHKYCLINNAHHSRYLQNAWNKYGEDCFEFRVLELCFSLICVLREQHYIDTLKPEYNISPIAGSCLGIKRTEETMAKMKKRYESPEAKVRQSETMKKCYRSPEARAKKSEVMKKYYAESSEETIAKRSEAMKKHWANPEARAKLSEAQKGNKNSLGHKHTQEAKNKMSNAHKGTTASMETRIKMSNASKGRKHTQEAIKKISEKMREVWYARRQEEL